jgi:hypothetical protein
MENSNLIKLQSLVEKRKEMMSSVRKFDDLFYKATKFELQEVVNKINNVLEKNTDESLKIFYDDPYDFSKLQYFTMIQLFVGPLNHGFYLEKAQRNPSIKFEGQEFNAKVKIFFKFQNQEKYKEVKEVPVDKLNQEFLMTIIVDFIEQVYNK